MDLIVQQISNIAFQEFTQSLENANKIYELHEGVIVEMPSPSPLHNIVSTLIAAHLAIYGNLYSVWDKVSLGFLS